MKICASCRNEIEFDEAYTTMEDSRLRHVDCVPPAECITITGVINKIKTLEANCFKEYCLQREIDYLKNKLYQERIFAGVMIVLAFIAGVWTV